MLRLWDGISVYNSEERARRRAQTAPHQGTYIAVMRFATEGAVRFERTTASRGHFTLWGDPSTLLTTVISVVPV